MCEGGGGGRTSALEYKPLSKIVPSWGVREALYPPLSHHWPLWEGWVAFQAFWTRALLSVKDSVPKGHSYVISHCSWLWEHRNHPFCLLTIESQQPLKYDPGNPRFRFGRKLRRHQGHYGMWWALVWERWQGTETPHSCCEAGPPGGADRQVAPRHSRRRYKTKNSPPMAATSAASGDIMASFRPELDSSGTQVHPAQT